METLFNQLARENNGDFTYEMSIKGFDVEISVCFWAMEIEIRYYRGLLTPVKKISYISLHGMFGNDTLEKKFQHILDNINNHHPFSDKKI
jgi:hypothetical protein